MSITTDPIIDTWKIITFDNNSIYVYICICSILRTSLSVPFSNETIMASRVNFFFIFIQSQLCNGFVVALENSKRLRWIVDIQVIYETAQWDGKQMRTLPQAGHLLIVNGCAHSEFRDHLRRFYVPQAACFISGATEELLAVRRPGDSVYTTLVCRTSDLKIKVVIIDLYTFDSVNLLTDAILYKISKFTWVITKWNNYQIRCLACGTKVGTFGIFFRFEN